MTDKLEELIIKNCIRDIQLRILKAGYDVSVEQINQILIDVENELCPTQIEIDDKEITT